MQIRAHGNQVPHPVGLRSWARAEPRELCYSPAAQAPWSANPGHREAEGALQGWSLAGEQQSRRCSVTRPTLPHAGWGTAPPGPAAAALPRPAVPVPSCVQHPTRGPGPPRGPVLHPKGPAGPDSTLGVSEHGEAEEWLETELPERPGRPGRGRCPSLAPGHCPPCCTQAGLAQGSLRNRRTEASARALQLVPTHDLRPRLHSTQGMEYFLLLSVLKKKI